MTMAAQDKDFPSALYVKIFSKPRVVLLSNEVEDYISLRKQHPLRFELKNVGNIFADFLESLGKVASDKAPKAGQQILGKRKIRYKREGLSYNATYFTEEHVYNDQTQINHHIKLANDGFLYKAIIEMEGQVAKGPINRHRSKTWYQLQADAIEDALGPLLTYADNFFDGNEYKFTLFYNASEERIDFKAYVSTDQLVITFEPGYPVADEGLLWAKRRPQR